jgi:integrase
MRVGESIGLDRDDLDWAAGCLLVRKGKPGAPRELPLHQSTVRALADYARLRDRHWPCPKAPAFFLSLAGTRLFYENVNWTFRRLVRQTGLPARAVRASTTCATVSRLSPSPTGMPPASMSPHRCRPCRPTWAMPIPAGRTGT